MSTDTFSDGVNKSKSQGSANFRIFIGKEPVEQFASDDVIGSLFFTQFSGTWPNRLIVRYGKRLELGDYQFDASKLLLPFSYRGQDLIYYEREGAASGSVIVTVRAVGNDWQVSGSLDVSYETPRPTIRVEGTFVLLINPATR